MCLKCYSILGEIDDSSSDENTTPTVDLTLPYCSNYTALGYKCVKVRTIYYKLYFVLYIFLVRGPYS